MPEQRTGDRSAGRGKAFHHAPKPGKRPPVAQEQKPYLVSRFTPHGVPVTVERLRSLRPNETILFYSGDLEADIDRAAGEAPDYHALLDLLRWTVVMLEERQRIVVRREERVIAVAGPSPAGEKLRRSRVIQVFNFATGVQPA